MSGGDRLRIALLTYRGHPEVGGQGVYVRYLSRALLEAGHDVEVFSGPPYPELDPGVRLNRVPSLDLYRPADPFRRPRRDEFGGAIDVLEYALMCTGGFPEPLTFSLRAPRVLATRGRFDIVHDNQCLGYGLLAMARRTPVIATVHHPIVVDRDIALAGAGSRRERVRLRRWYGFVRMQARVARRLPRLVAVSARGRRDVAAAFGVPEGRVRVVPNGVDTELFRPLRGHRRSPHRVIAVASSDMPTKGLDVLIEAIAKLGTERPVELVLVGAGGTGERVRAAVRRFGVGRSVTATGRVDVLDMVELYASAAVAVVPSLYEGFSLPALEAMSCGVPLVATRAGAIPQLAGDGAAVLVPPGDAGALAAALGMLLDDPVRRAALGRAGRDRVVRRFSWAVAAHAALDVYREVVRRC